MADISKDRKYVMKSKAVAVVRDCLIVFLLLVMGLLAAIPTAQPVYALAGRIDPGKPVILQADPPKTYPIMKMTAEQARAEDAEAAKLPRAYIDAQIRRDLAANTDGTSKTLLSYIQYTPSARNQGSCGDCWAWAGTGCLEVALNVQRGIKDRLSVQYLNSNYYSGTGSNFACCGGGASGFANFYNSSMKAIPWSNTNAGFADAGRSCGSSTAMPAGSIATTPNYPLSACAAYTVTTHGVAQSTAIANIKNVLDQNKAIYFSFRQANSADWGIFFTFWDDQAESVLWNGGYSCGGTWGSGAGGHAVLCVGYDDAGANPYWVMLNSWGTTAGRPNGLFRIPMNYDYDCSISGVGYATNWYTIEPTFAPATAPTVTNGSGATSIMSTTAILNGYLTSNGGAATTVHICGGTTDGVENPDNWGHDENLGVLPVGPFSMGVTGLTPGTTYYYRCYATNSVGPSWASETYSFVAQSAWAAYWAGPGKDWWRFSSGTTR